MWLIVWQRFIKKELTLPAKIDLQEIAHFGKLMKTRNSYPVLWEGNQKKKIMSFKINTNSCARSKMDDAVISFFRRHFFLDMKEQIIGLKCHQATKLKNSLNICCWRFNDTFLDFYFQVIQCEGFCGGFNICLIF